MCLRKLRPVVEDENRVTTSPRVTPRGEGRVVGATENALGDIGRTQYIDEHDRPSPSRRLRSLTRRHLSLLDPVVAPRRAASPGVSRRFIERTGS